MSDADPKVWFGTRLRQLREAKGWSQEKLAQVVGLDRSYIGGVERGERNISLENIDRLAHALKVTPATLFENWGSRS